MSNEPRLFTLIPFGAPGVGKSNLMNKLIGKEGRFISSSAVTSGVTKNISYEQGPAFGIEGNPLLRVYDVPGVGDYDLPMIDIIDDIKKNIGSKQNIDAALVVLKITDYRMSIQEMYAIKTITRMIDNSNSGDTFMILTHCDKLQPSDELISGKLASFKKSGPLDIPREKVINFDNTTESLRQFISKLKKSDMHFHENLEEKVKEIKKELPGDFKLQDAAEGTHNLEMYKMMLEM